MANQPLRAPQPPPRLFASPTIFQHDRFVCHRLICHYHRVSSPSAPLPTHLHLSTLHSQQLQHENCHGAIGSRANISYNRVVNTTGSPRHADLAVWDSTRLSPSLFTALHSPHIIREQTNCTGKLSARAMIISLRSFKFARIAKLQWSHDNQNCKVNWVTYFELWNNLEKLHKIRQDFTHILYNTLHF